MEWVTVRRKSGEMEQNWATGCWLCVALGEGWADGWRHLDPGKVAPGPFASTQHNAFSCEPKDGQAENCRT